MKTRQYWVNRLEESWDRSSLLWLAGVRRAGKTFLCHSLNDIEYFDCELPSTRRQLRNPQDFLDKVRGKRIVLDEIHRLKRPAAVLKLAADAYPDIKILATGPSALKSSPDFKRDLVGQMEEVWLTPLMSVGLKDFGNKDVVHRLYAGGLPPFFLSKELPEKEYQGWMDSYWAKDVQTRFRVAKRWSFEQFLQMIFENSGGIFEAVKFSEPCEISRTSVSNYLKVMEDTLVVHVIRPFTTRRPTEIVSAPRVYAFDTGFVCYFRGWEHLRRDDLKRLWTHFILNEIQSRMQIRDVRYWRDKHGHEVDFVLADQDRKPVAIECSWASDDVSTRSIHAFRTQYPHGENWIISHDVDEPYELVERNLTFKYMGLETLAQLLEVRKSPAGYV